jgi:hypothetical protein
MDKVKSKESFNIFTVMHVILLPALIVLTAYITMEGISFVLIGGTVFVIIGVQAFFSIVFASAKKTMPKVIIVLEPLFAFIGVLIMFLIVNK